MKYLLIIIALVIISIISFVVVSSNDDAVNINEKPIENNKQPLSFKNILPVELEKLLDSDEDIFLLDVHTPEQKHIDGTDIFIPYDDIEGNISKLPQDKNKKIVVYCRSGSMSQIASKKLLNLGYTNVLNLEGGIKVWNGYKKIN